MATLPSWSAQAWGDHSVNALDQHWRFAPILTHRRFFRVLPTPVGAFHIARRRDQDARRRFKIVALHDRQGNRRPILPRLAHRDTHTLQIKGALVAIANHGFGARRVDRHTSFAIAAISRQLLIRADDCL